MSNDFGGSSHSLPSIPRSLNDSLTLRYLTDRDREELARHLDVESVWKFVAEDLGMTTNEIRWISHRETRMGSETLLFLNDLERKGVTLKQFIKAVNDSSYQVLPVIDFLNRRYPEIEKKYQLEMHLSQSIPGNHSKSHFFRLETSPFQKCKSKTHVLLSHHQEDSKLMLNVAHCLMRNGFAVSIDKQEQLMKDSMSMNDGNRMRIQKIFDAAYTFLLVSPSFLKDIVKYSGLTIDDSNPNASSLYIIKMVKAMAVERNAEKVERFVIALVNGATVADVPAWMKNIKMYYWPKDYEDILLFIMDPKEVIRKFLDEHSQKSNSFGRMSQHRCQRCLGSGRCSSRKN